MDPDTFRDDLGADVYWRRRMTALIAVLMVVAVVAWACSATGGPDDVRKRGGTTAQETPDAVPGVLPPSEVTPSASWSRTPSPGTSRATGAAGTAVRHRRPGQACTPGQLVLSMEGQGTVYPAGIRPRFILTLVNVGKVMCTAEVGPRSLEVRITSGPDRVWSSSDCISGETDHVDRLERGVPYVRELVWDRRRSGNDCASDRVAARPGTYVAVAHAPGLRSRKAVFHLR
ncbi:hypothetical protein ACIBCT_18330 [Streptosporangium sp. NPDC050855]|uniref:hypothetical protein n=1 Tax=Streptosporangium sp. NPDC050855 TaxID=3366194 RepID=UPI0037A08882